MVEMTNIYELYEMISDISERCYFAGWMGDIEFILWNAIENGCKSFDYGGSEVKSEELKKLKELAEKVNGWWTWAEILKRYKDQSLGDGTFYTNDFCVFVSLYDWKNIFKIWKLNNKVIK